MGSLLSVKVRLLDVPRYVAGTGDENLVMSYIVWGNGGQRDLTNYNFIREFFSDLNVMRGYFQAEPLERNEDEPDDGNFN